ASVGAEMAPPSRIATRLRAARRVIRSSWSMLSSSFDVPPDAGGRRVLCPHGRVALAVVRDLRGRVDDAYSPLQQSAADAVRRQYGKARARSEERRVGKACRRRWA